MARTINVGGIEVFADYILAVGGQAVAVSWFHRSSNKVQSVACKMGKASIVGRDRYPRINVSTRGAYKTPAVKVKNGRSVFYSGLAISASIGESVMITTNTDVNVDFYNFLMQKFSLPLLPEWTAYLIDRCVADRKVQEERKWNFLVCGDENRQVTLNGKKRRLGDLKGYLVLLSESDLETYVSEGLMRKDIRIAEKDSKPLEFKDFNDYITKYGKSLVKNLEEEITPLQELKPVVDGVAHYKMRLFPQQSAAVNGMIALKNSGAKYGLLNEGMGVGKTIQALSVVEGAFNEEYMKKHACSLKETLEKGEVSYRVAIMCPSHLVAKWAQTIAEEIPYAKPIMVTNFSQFVKLREHGPSRDAKEFYIFSKDFAKLDTTYEPIPTKYVSRHAYVKVCKQCQTEAGIRVQAKKYGQKKCLECGGTEWTKEKIHSLPFKGLLCPSCGEILIKNKLVTDKDREELEDVILTPKDFASKTTANATCYHCGEQLWGVAAKTMTTGDNASWFSKLASREKAWHKITHYKNYSMKSNTNSFVLRRFSKDEEGVLDYLTNNTIPNNEYTISPAKDGPRKYAPAKYIKKYLRGYFDFLILDECHKFEGAGSAQANAAHSLMKASDFTLGLTGTLLNGKASSIFYLMFMLDPSRMVEKGFDYGSVMQFAKQYGCIETVHEAGDDDVVKYKSSSRGKQIGQPREKPGISPLVYVDFLLDKAVFLDLSDLSKYLPKLHEKVEIIPQEEDVAAGYQVTLRALKDSLRKPEGKNMMSYVLNFGLSYPDKPYGRGPIMSIKQEGVCVANPINCDNYIEDELLNKEKKLVEIVSEELENNRNCFIFCSYTGDPESNVTERLKNIIETRCNLKGRVQIITASNPSAVNREEWMHERAADGMKVFICNPKVVETGLDFCFKHLDEVYNYPTLIFYQMSYELAVLWQASRRAYRLNQKEECHNYYLCYEGTLQQVAVQLMAEKQVATSAIQGKFSAEGLASMANGVDPKVKLAQALASGDTGDRASLENMFDVLNTSNNEEDSEDSVVKSLTYEEVMGHAREDIVIEEPTLETLVVPAKVITPKANKASEEVVGQMSIFDVQLSILDLLGEEEVKEEKAPKKKATNKKKVANKSEEQLSILDLLVSA